MTSNDRPAGHGEAEKRAEAAKPGGEAGERTAAVTGAATAGGAQAGERSFAELGLDGRLAERLAGAGIVRPTGVQAEAIPALLAGRDGVLRSATGSGKTLAYLLPLLQRIDAEKAETQAIVLAPTQELAMQIVRVAETYGEPLGIRTVALIGGAALSRQLDRMKRRPQLVVGTPGRVREVAARKKLPFHPVRIVVVDETDRVFSLGGRGDVEAILRGASRERQTVFVSATRSDAMREAESLWLRDPWEPAAAAQTAGGGLPAEIEHWFFVCDRRDKIDLVRRLALHLKPAAALLFVNDMEKIGELVAKLRYEGLSVEALYGDTPGRERSDAMRKFREGRVKLLIATDVAARGLDVPGLPLVVQFEPALDADHYVHRAGRTGRMGLPGLSITLVTPRERFIVDKLSKRLGIAFAEKTLRGGQAVDAGERAGRPAAGRAAAGKGRPAAPRRGAEAVEPAAKSGAAPVGARSAAKPQRAAAGAARPAAGARATGGERAPAAGGSGPQRGAVRPEMRSQPGGAPERRQAAPEAAGPASRAGRADAPPPAPDRPAKAKAKAKAARERDTKNKGAPRWLKEKRVQSAASAADSGSEP